MKIAHDTQLRAHVYVLDAYMYREKLNIFYIHHRTFVENLLSSIIRVELQLLN